MSATLDDQLATVLAAVDAAPGKPLVVGHSAASTLAWLAADRRPERVAKVALIGGFPTADGQPYADFFEVTDGVMPFPGWAPSRGRTPPTSTTGPGESWRPPRSRCPQACPRQWCD